MISSAFHSLEVGMGQGLLRSESLTWVHFHQLLDEVQTLWSRLSQITIVDSFEDVDVGKSSAYKTRVLQEDFAMLCSEGA